MRRRGLGPSYRNVAFSHCQVTNNSVDPEEITPLLSDSGKAIGANVVTNSSDDGSTMVLKCYASII